MIRDAYHDLFEIYPDAQNRPEKDIHNFIGKNTTAAIRMVGAMVSVFKMLCSLADFEGEPVSMEEVAATQPGTDQLSRGTEKLTKDVEAFDERNVSIQLHLTVAESATIEQIEATFKYAAKYLLGRTV